MKIKVLLKNGSVEEIFANYAPARVNTIGTAAAYKEPGRCWITDEAAEDRLDVSFSEIEYAERPVEIYSAYSGRLLRRVPAGQAYLFE